MTDKQLSLLAPGIATQARDEILSVLHTAENPGGWMDFMDTVTKLLPDILSTGRPSTEAVKRSIIGQLGFKSWQEMIEAPAARYGLGWNYSAWKAWRRAWTVVQANPWLRSSELTSSEINTWSIELKRLGQPFPGSLEALQQLQADKTAAAAQRRSETLAETQKALAEALQEIERLKATSGAQERNEALVEAQAALGEVRRQLETVSAQLHLERAASGDQATEIGRLQGVIDGLRGEVEQLRTAASDTRFPRLSRLQHLRAFLFGS